MESEINEKEYNDAVVITRTANKAACSLLQRKLRIGYFRAAHIMDLMEGRGVVSPPDPVTHLRKIL